MSRTRLPTVTTASAVALFALAWPLAFVAPALAQGDAPRLQRLGPIPNQPELALPDTGEPELASLPRSTTTVVLRAAGATPASKLLATVDALCVRGVVRVHFAARLPDGTPGAVVLALPATADAPTHLTLRAHRDRAGVPASSALPLLRRLATGWHTQPDAELVLDIEVPANATTEQTLGLLQVAAAAGVRSVVLRAGPASAAEGKAALALDLAGSITAQVPAIEVATDEPAVRAESVGCLIPPPATLPARRGGGAGGRFGGRGGAAPALAPDARASWLDRQVQPDGSLRMANGEPDLTGVALRCLTLLADGTTLDSGTAAARLRPNLGYLLAQQRDDGSFEPIAPGSVARHAQITYALAEAAGLSPSGALLHEALVDALRYLASRRELDGSFAAIPGTPGDAVTTAWARMACMSAEFFGFDVPLPAAATLAWFDRNGRDDALPAAPELCARVFSGQDAKTTPRVAALAAIVLAKGDAGEPQQAFWATLGLFQIGGRPWQQWNKRVDAAIVKRQSRDGEFQGTWDPPADLTRAQATTLNILTLQAHYRYSKLVR